jgi:ribonuclease R/exosome complex exonuclease DIS3/RRP44
LGFFLTKEMEKKERINIGDILEGRISSSASGSAYLVNNDLPKDIYINKANTNKALHLDTVKIEVIQGDGRAIEGKVIEIVERFRTEFVGTIQISKRFAFFIPDSNKLPIDFYVPLKKTMKAKDGQKVVVRLTEWEDKAKNPNGEVVRIIGDSGEHETEIHSILEEYGLPYDFDADVIAESEAISEIISQAEIDKRRDMRNVLTFTIDPADAKDFDDALSVEWVNGVLEVGVHIADVSHYLRPETQLDKDAYSRGTSVYLVDRVVPMLPERLSNGLCSLRPHEDKLCFSAVFKLDQNGHVLEEWFGRTVINSDHRFIYEEAQEIIEWKDYNSVSNLFKKTGLVDFSIDEKVDENLIKATKLANAILDLDKIAKKMRKARLSKGSISFDKNEVRFDLDENNKPKGIKFKASKDSNKLIEEFMLLANRHVAQFINSKGYPMVNRAHDKPDELKLNNLKTFISQFGYDIKTDDPVEITRTLNKLLIDVKGTAEEDMINNLVVRTMQKADYRVQNIGHYGLGFKHYTHFTSPIRRYPDVMVHRLLSRYLESKPNPKIEKLDAKCSYLSEREKKAQKAERDSIKYMQCIYMSDHVGKVYKGMITSVSEYGLFVEILETKCEGMIRLSEIEGDTYIADVQNYCVNGFNSGTKLRLGDEVMVTVKSVDIEKKNINLSLF